MEDCGVSDRLRELKQWYDGYMFGGLEIYNPWSIIKYVDAGCKFEPYWLNMSGNSILRVMLEHVDARRRKDLEGLMQDRPVTAAIDEGAIYPDIRRDSNTLYMMLLTTGYLKAVEAVWPSSGNARCKLLIPNREVRVAYHREILSSLGGGLGGMLILEEMLEAMLAGDVETFRQGLGDILRDYVSFHDTAQSESFYHGMMLGFSVLTQGSYRVESNGESGYGRFDLAFFPEKENTPGVILEFKKAQSEDELEAKAKEALAQIEEKEYETALQRQSVREIWKYGISFSGKRVYMEKG